MADREFLKRLGITGVGIAVYLLGYQIPLPVLVEGSSEILQSLQPDSARFSILALGIGPFVFGFMLIEFFSFLPTWGAKYRRGGREGRKKLNELAIRVALVAAVFQAFGLMMALGAFRSPGGLPLMPSGLGARMIAILTWIAASVALFGLCQLLSRRGLGNGFCVLIAVDLIIGMWQFWTRFDHRADLEWSEQVMRFALLAALTGAAFVFYFRRRARCEVSYHGEPSGQLPLPSLPQSLGPLTWAPMLLLLPSTVGPLLGAAEGFGTFGFTGYLLSIGILVPLLSFLAVHLFSTRKRVEANVPGLSLSADFEAAHSKSLYGTTSFLTLLVLAWAALNHLTYGYGLAAAPIVVLAAVATDLFEEWRFRRAFPTAVRWQELDNVHLASYVGSLLQQKGIPCAIQAFHFRSLFFFFSPLEKMALLVPEERLDEAQDLMAELEAPIL